jgi:hypothetical protein
VHPLFGQHQPTRKSIAEEYIGWLMSEIEPDRLSTWTQSYRNLFFDFDRHSREQVDFGMHLYGRSIAAPPLGKI